VWERRMKSDPALAAAKLAELDTIEAANGTRFVNFNRSGWKPALYPPGYTKVSAPPGSPPGASAGRRPSQWRCIDVPGRSGLR
jgi:hypothetical protein